MKRNILLFTTLFLVSTSALAQEQSTPVAQEKAASWGLNLDLGFATAYVFRGANLFNQGEQMDQNMLLAPGITWKVFDTGLTVGYWGAFQLNGDNVSANIDGGIGAETDLLVSYDYALTDALSLSGGLVYYFYPGADKNVTGASVPSYLEPGVGVSYSTVVDLGLKMAYFLGVQDQPGIRGVSYFYLNPTVGKSLSLTDWASLDLSFGYGFKLFKEGNDGASNVHDLLLGVGVPITAISKLYIKPSLNLAWTNIAEQDFGDGLVFWGGLNVGTDL